MKSKVFLLKKEKGDIGDVILNPDLKEIYPECTGEFQNKLFPLLGVDLSKVRPDLSGMGYFIEHDSSIENIKYKIKDGKYITNITISSAENLDVNCKKVEGCGVIIPHEFETNVIESEGDEEYIDTEKFDYEFDLSD